jgi:hypothetical protein
MPAKKKAPVAVKASTPAPKQTRSHPTLEAWIGQPANILRLKQILADPVFIAACHYVESSVSVNPNDLIGPKAEQAEVIVRKTALAAGVRIFTTTIAALPNFRQKHASDDAEPWSHIQAPTR